MFEIDILATIASLVGAVLTASGKPSWMPASLLTYVIGSIFWSIYAFNTHQIPLLVLNITFIIVELYGLWRWMKRSTLEAELSKGMR